eukprot:m.189784 g.189784  ORF g.189784 m.189784 type:complete len:201 (-) comp53616_c0_seq11:276-878(-)
MLVRAKFLFRCYGRSRPSMQTSRARDTRRSADLQDKDGRMHQTLCTSFGRIGKGKSCPFFHVRWICGRNRFGRWEHDKNPEEFFAALFQLQELGLSFHVSVVVSLFYLVEDAWLICIFLFCVIWFQGQTFSEVSRSLRVSLHDYSEAFLCRSHRSLKKPELSFKRTSSTGATSHEKTTCSPWRKQMLLSRRLNTSSLACP